MRSSTFMTSRRYLVFVSHSSRDTWVASAIAQRVRQCGGEVWLGVDELSSGDPIYSRILDAVSACDEAIVFLSPYSLNSNWVLFEMGAICGQRKRVTPILSHVGAESIPVISDIKAIDIDQFEQQFLPDLAKRIAEKPLKALIGREKKRRGG